MGGECDGGPLGMTITFLGLNKPVPVTGSPARDTTDLAGLMKNAQG